MTKRASSSYLAYMLRLWTASSEEGIQWRASLEDPHTGERKAFANMKMMFAFLEEQTGLCIARRNDASGSEAAERTAVQDAEGHARGRNSLVRAAIK